MKICLKHLPDFKKRFEWFLAHREDLCVKVACMQTKRVNNRRILSLIDGDKLKRILEKMLDEKEFLSPYGIRSVSLFHKDHPFLIRSDGTVHQVDYEPAESTDSLFGGNSNWRGPIWMPINYMIIEALQKYHYYYGDDFKVECPTGSGNLLTLWEVASEISNRLIKIFEKDLNGHRPVFGKNHKFQTDPAFQDLILYYEYFQGDNGFVVWGFSSNWMDIAHC